MPIDNLLNLIDARVIKRLRDEGITHHDDFIKGLYATKQMVVDEINRDTPKVLIGCKDKKDKMFKCKDCSYKQNTKGCIDSRFYSMKNAIYK